MDRKVVVVETGGNTVVDEDSVGVVGVGLGSIAGVVLISVNSVLGFAVEIGASVEVGVLVENCDVVVATVAVVGECGFGVSGVLVVVVVGFERGVSL